MLASDAKIISSLDTLGKLISPTGTLTARTLQVFLGHRGAQRYAGPLRKAGGDLQANAVFTPQRLVGCPALPS